MLLLDASVWLAAFDRDDLYHEPAQAILRASAEGSIGLAALDLTLYEVATVAVVRWRSPADAERLVDLIGLACADTLERADEALVRQAAVAAADHDLTVYDAAYVVVARERDWKLVSADLNDLVGPGHAVAPDVAL